MTASQFACTSCGAGIEYAPGTQVLRCPYCGAEQAVPAASREVVEHSYAAWAAAPTAPAAQVGAYVLSCQRCGASVETNALAERCSFCAAPVVVDPAAVPLLPPEAVLPFGVEKAGANDAVRSWVRSRWFAPNALKKVATTESIAGTYIPHWTYDSSTRTWYQGQRGDHYYVTESYRDAQGNMQTRQVRHTRWWPASGEVARDFDDVLVPASSKVDPGTLEKLGPWELSAATAFQPEYLSGFGAQRYDIDPDAGRREAEVQMEAVIRQDVRSDIGGDEQRIFSMDVQHSNVHFKLLLLPLWIATYLYAGKSYQVFVNANTGEVVGERPYSVWKIALASLLALLVIGLLVFLWMQYRSSGDATGSTVYYGMAPSLVLSWFEALVPL